MTRYALTIEFNGRDYFGWQRQESDPTIQGCIEEAIAKITPEKVVVYAAGRTDAGVHARAMRAHVDIEKPLPAHRIMDAINAHLRPHPISILACEVVADDWHARFDCTGRAYEYHIINRRSPLALDHGLAWRVPQYLDEMAMHDAAQVLVGLHDFTTFRSVNCQSDSPIKTLDTLDVRRENEMIIITAEARSFLHHQVRSMVGCLALVGRGKWTRADLIHALNAKNRAALGHNAPADGLYFMKAIY
jgi:tRNA pseudouridine38-40 synthase